MKRSGLFRNTRWDLLHVLVVLGLLSLQVWAAVRFETLSIWALLATFCAMTYLGFLTSKTQHLHAHTPYFNSRVLNQAFGVAVSVLNRVPQVTYYYTHVIVHHRKTIAYTNFRLIDLMGIGSLRDALFLPWTAVQNAFSVFWVGVLRQAYKNRDQTLERPEEYHEFESYDAYFEKAIPGLLYWIREGGAPRLRAFTIELAVSIAYPAMLLAIDWRYFLLFYVPCRCIAEDWILSYEEYCEHWGIMDASSSLTDAVSSYGPVNLLIFNAGYHQEHHARPGLHWTKLPAARADMLPDEQRRVVPVHYFTSPFFPASRPEEPPVESS